MFLRTTLFRVKGGYCIALLYDPIFRHQQIITAVDSLLTRSYLKYPVGSSAVILGFFFQSERHH
jgi:hypothetical protein